MGWLQRLTILTIDKPKSPWGGSGGGSGNGGSGGDGDGPRNPWSVPPGGRPRVPGPSALDELLRRARGGGSGGGGRPQLPGAPGARACG